MRPGRASGTRRAADPHDRRPSAQRLYEIAERVATRLEVAELVEAGTRGRGGRCPRETRRGQPRARRSRDRLRARMVGTPADSSAAAISSAASPTTYARVRPEGGGERGRRTSFFSATSEDHAAQSLLGAMRARIAAATFVAFESLTNRTPRTVATSSIRCSTPRKLMVRARDVVSSEMPTARRERGGGGVLAVVQTRYRGLGGSGSSAANSTLRAAPGTGPNPRGTTATSFSVWSRNSRSLVSAYDRQVAVAIEVDPARGSRALRCEDKTSMSSSWKTPTSQTIQVSGSMPRRAS